MKIFSVKTISFYLLLVLVALGQFQRLQLTPQIAVYAHEILMVVWLGSAIPRRLSVWQKITAQLLRRYRLIAPLLLWITLGLTGYTLIQPLSLVPWLYISRLGLYLLFGIELWSQRSKLPHAQEAWLVAGLNILFLGLVQYLLLPDTRFLRIMGWDDHYYRLISTQFDPNFTGMLLVLTFCQLRAVKWPKLLVIGLASLLIIGILLTYSRASYLSLIGVLLVFLWQGRKRVQRLVVLSLLALFLISIPLLPRKASEGTLLIRTASITARISNIISAIQFEQPYQWVIGAGLFVPAESTPRPTPIPEHAKFADNILVFWLVGTGVVGLGLFIILTTQGLTHFQQTSPMLLAGATAILVHSQFNLTLFQPFVLLYFLGMITSDQPVVKA